MREPETEYERGEKAGRHKQILEDLVVHSREVNGSIANMKGALGELAGLIRAQGEEQRIRDERVEAARAALAAETERRRTELADTVATDDRKFTRREKLLTTAFSLAFLGLAILMAVR